MSFLGKRVPLGKIASGYAVIQALTFFGPAEQVTSTVCGLFGQVKISLKSNFRIWPTIQ
jgi:hypothetical protein